MRRFALALVAAVLAVCATPLHARADAPAPCPVTVHVSNAGAFTISNCKGAHKTTNRRLKSDLRMMLGRAGRDKGRVIFDAGPEAPLYATMTAMNAAHDIGVYDFEIIDEPGRPAFMISMPPAPFVVPPSGDVVEDVDTVHRWYAREKIDLIFVRVRPDHLLDVYDAGPPMRPEGRAMGVANPTDARYFTAMGVKMEDLPLLMPPPNARDFALVEGADARWMDVRTIYRIFAAGGYGRLSSVDPAYM